MKNEDQNGKREGVYPASAANRTRGPSMATMDFTTKPLTLDEIPSRMLDLARGCRPTLRSTPDRNPFRPLSDPCRSPRPITPSHHRRKTNGPSPLKRGGRIKTISKCLYIQSHIYTLHSIHIHPPFLSTPFPPQDKSETFPRPQTHNIPPVYQPPSSQTSRLRLKLISLNPPGLPFGAPLQPHPLQLLRDILMQMPIRLSLGLRPLQITHRQPAALDRPPTARRLAATLSPAVVRSVHVRAVVAAGSERAAGRAAAEARRVGGEHRGLGGLGAVADLAV